VKNTSPNPNAAAHANQPPEARQAADLQMDRIMAILLRSGVLIAAALVLIGGIIFLARHSQLADYRTFQSEPAELRTIPGIAQQAREGHGRGLIQLGLLLLIATPVARVLFSVFSFARQKDWTYVAVTLIVLALLTYSLLGGSG
jgi:uncharacterized membrane protein